MKTIETTIEVDGSGHINIDAQVDLPQGSHRAVLHVEDSMTQVVDPRKRYPVLDKPPLECAPFNWTTTFSREDLYSNDDLSSSRLL